MYNVMWHGTTRQSSSQLLFGRNIRDKIPATSDLIRNEGDQETTDNIILNKYKGKEREDNTRGATECDIQPRDKVIAQNVTNSNKLESRKKMK